MAFYNLSVICVGLIPLQKLCTKLVDDDPQKQQDSLYQKQMVIACKAIIQTRVFTPFLLRFLKINYKKWKLKEFLTPF